MKVVRWLVISLFSLACGLYSLYLMIIKDYLSLVIFFGVMALIFIINSISKPTKERDSAIESIKAPSVHPLHENSLTTGNPKTRWGLFGGLLIGVLLGPFAILIMIGLAEWGPLALIDRLSNPSQAQQAITENSVTLPERPALNFPYGVDQSDPDNYAQVLDLAERGNYQAQRNIAYGFAVDVSPYHNQSHNPVLGCAWYLVVLNSNSHKVNSTDQENVNLWCGKLDKDLLETSKHLAFKFLSQIENKTKFGKLDD